MKREKVTQSQYEDDTDGKTRISYGQFVAMRQSESSVSQSCNVTSLSPARS